MNQSASNPSTPAVRRPRIIALMNQKGGVGKTTTTVNLGAALSLKKQRVLLVDLDPQAHLSLHVGVNPDELDKSIYHLLTDPSVSALEVIHEIDRRLSVIPAEVNLAGAEGELAHLSDSGHAQRILREKLAAVLGEEARQAASLNEEKSTPDTRHPTPASVFDFVLLDCPPSLGLLTVNALALATEVFVPMQAHFLALQGLSKLLSTVSMVRQSINPNLKVSGIILCLHDGQTVLATEVMADLEGFLASARQMDVPWRDAVVLQPPIRRNIKLAESPSFGKTVFDYAPLCPGAQDYRALAECVLAMKGV